MAEHAKTVERSSSFERPSQRLDPDELYLLISNKLEETWDLFVHRTFRLCFTIYLTCFLSSKLINFFI